MNKDEILKQLTEVKDKIIFFKDLTEFQIKILIDEIVFAKFNKNETIFKQNDSKNQFIYYILSGSVKVNVTDKFGVTKTITTLSHGTLIGEMQAILNNKRTASCISASDNTVLIGFTINEYNHKEHGNTYALFYKNISKVLAQKIQDTNLKVL